ncbi:hypothetical protein EGW08_005222, partial [Elysia chlorotica]
MDALPRARSVRSLPKQPALKLQDLVISESQAVALDCLPDLETASKAKTSRSGMEQVSGSDKFEMSNNSWNSLPQLEVSQPINTQNCGEQTEDKSPKFLNNSDPDIVTCADQGVNDAKLCSSDSLFSDSDKDRLSRSRGSEEAVVLNPPLQAEPACIRDGPREIEAELSQASNASSDEDIFILNPGRNLPTKTHFENV